MWLDKATSSDDTLCGTAIPRTPREDLRLHTTHNKAAYDTNRRMIRVPDGSVYLADMQIVQFATEMSTYRHPNDIKYKEMFLEMQVRLPCLLVHQFRI
jgi:hypothetical protein